MTKVKEIPFTQDWLKEHVHYDDHTGLFTLKKKWKAKTTRSVLEVGSVLGHLNGHGYLHFSIMGRKYKACRLAWFYVYGENPQGFIDHINGDRLDDRIQNLRVVTNSQNQQNKRGIRSISGKKGVYPGKANKWIAQYNKIHLGTFHTILEAATAYDDYVENNLGEYGLSNRAMEEENVKRCEQV